MYMQGNRNLIGCVVLKLLFNKFLIFFLHFMNLVNHYLKTHLE